MFGDGAMLLLPLFVAPPVPLGELPPRPGPFAVELVPPPVVSPVLAGGLPDWSEGGAMGTATMAGG